MVAAGDDPTALTPVMRTQLAASVAAAADVPASAVTLRVVAASLLLIFDVAVDTAAASKGIAASLAARMATPEAATMLVSVAGVTVIATPATRALVETVLAPSPSPPPPPGVAATPPPPPTGDDEDDIADDESLVGTGGGSDAGAIAGGVLGGLAAVVLLGAAAFVYQVRFRVRVTSPSPSPSPSPNPNPNPNPSPYPNQVAVAAHRESVCGP